MQTEFIINLSALPALLWMLESQKKNIRKEACWTISNITAGKFTLAQLQSLAHFISYFSILRDLCANPGSYQRGSVSEANFASTVFRIRYPEGGRMGCVERYIRR